MIHSGKNLPVTKTDEDPHSPALQPDMKIVDSGKDISLAGFKSKTAGLIKLDEISIPRSTRVVSDTRGIPFQNQRAAGIMLPGSRLIRVQKKFEFQNGLSSHF
jgi:hypothetical protein